MKCACGANLVGRLEAVVDLCSSCITSKVREADVLAGRVSELSEKLTSTNERLDRVTTAHVGQLRLVRAERDGRDAAERGLTLDDNPCEGDDERLVWASGWAEADGHEQMARALSVVRWAAEALEIISQLSGEEVSGKIETVREKLMTLVEDT